MKGNVILEKSKAFAVRIIRLYKYLLADHSEHVIFKQLLRCGTSIGANVTEANDAISKKDFLNKMYIALKECSETLYWLELLYRTDYLSKPQYESIASDCLELRRILRSITKSTKDG